MEEHKIPVRRSKAEAELIQLREQVESYKQLILRIAAYTNLPTSIARSMSDEFDMNGEIADALKLNRRQMA